MKKLNKKGFAISTLIYSILIMGILIMGMLYSTIAFRKKTTSDFTRNVEENLINREIKNYTVCKAATELHNANLGGTTVTYGTIPNGNKLKAGDAFDCDVNADNQFDPEYERFYYLSPENGEDEDTSTKITLIYYSNTYSYSGAVTPTNIEGAVDYYSAGINPNVQTQPKTASKHLPKNDLWKNTSLIAPGVVDIKDETNAKKVEDFDYGNSAARLPRLKEILRATGATMTDSGTPNNSLSGFSFLFENLKSETGYAKGYWLEDVVSSSMTQAWTIDVENKKITKVNNDSINYGSRPVIVVEKENVYFE